VHVRDDNGEDVMVLPDDELFEYLDEVYAVVVVPFEHLGIGEVTVVDDASADGMMLSVKGAGFFSRSQLVILDRTNLVPGITVMDNSTGLWVRVNRIDECMWFACERVKIMRSPEEFTFAVADGDILAGPMVRCVRADGEPNLTEGRVYTVERQYQDGMWGLEDDSGKTGKYMPDRFRMGG